MHEPMHSHIPAILHHDIGHQPYLIPYILYDEKEGIIPRGKQGAAFQASHHRVLTVPSFTAKFGGVNA